MGGRREYNSAEHREPPQLFEICGVFYRKAEGTVWGSNASTHPLATSGLHYRIHYASGTGAHPEAVHIGLIQRCGDSLSQVRRRGAQPQDPASGAGA